MRHPAVLAAARRWAALAVGIVIVAVGWWASSTGVYVLGLVATSLGVVVALRGRGLWRLLAVVVVAALGVGGPWLAIRLAYQEVGTAVSPWVRSYWEPLSWDEDVIRLVHGGTVVALDRAGEIAWRVDLPDLTRVWALDDGRMVGAAGEELVGLEADGTSLWSRPRLGSVDLVAQSDGIVVQRACADREDARATCTWTGVDAGAGSVAWEITGTWAPGWPMADDIDSFTQVGTIGTALFTATGQEGRLEVREAVTGAVVAELADDGAIPVLTGDAVLAIRECSAELHRAGRIEWTSEFDCALWEGPTYPFSFAGSRVGDSYWAKSVEGEGTLVIDLRDGTVRTEGHSYGSAFHPYGFDEDRVPVHVLGAGVDVVVGAGTVVVRDPADGRELWDVTAAAADIRSIQAADQLVVVTTYTDALLLHEWFAPWDPGRVAVRVYAARTGELLAAVRTEGLMWSPMLVGDHVLLDVPDAEGDLELRMVGSD